MVFRVRRDPRGVVSGSILIVKFGAYYLCSMNAVLQCLVNAFRTQRIERRGRITDSGPVLTARALALRNRDGANHERTEPERLFGKARADMAGGS